MSEFGGFRNGLGFGLGVGTAAFINAEMAANWRSNAMCRFSDPRSMAMMRERFCGDFGGPRNYRFQMPLQFGGAYQQGVRDGYMEARLESYQYGGRRPINPRQAEYLLNGAQATMMREMAMAMRYGLNS